MAENTFSEDEVIIIKNLFQECLESYIAKDGVTTNKEWLKEELFQKIKGMTKEKASMDAETIVQTVESISGSLCSMQEAEQQGISKEKWLANVIQDDLEREPSVISEEEIIQFDDSLYTKNIGMAGMSADSNFYNSENNITEDSGINHSPLLQLKDIALDIGKNASTYGIQCASSTAGTMLVERVLNNEEIAPNEIVQKALQSGTDMSMQTIAAGVLKIASDNQFVQFLPKSIPTGLIACIASGGIESAKIAANIASEKLSVTDGIKYFGRLGVALVKNIWSVAKKQSFKGVIKGFLSFLGPEFAIASEIIGTVVAFMGGTDFGKKIVAAKAKIASAAKNVAKAAVKSLNRAKESIKRRLRNVRKVLSRVFN